MPAVHFLVPEGTDDPARPSGGNGYDRRLGAGLAAAGWDVRWYPVAGCWPEPDPAAGDALAVLLTGLPDGAVLLVDGLVAASAPAVLTAQAGRLRLVVLVHMPQDADRPVLAAAAAVVTTSDWTRARLLARQPLESVHVARPGADRAEPATGTAAGNRLLCVAALAPHKGQDLLVAALAELADRSWHCTLLGPLDRDPAFVERLRRQAAGAGIADRVELAGPAVGTALDRAYRSADLLVLPSRTEAYGMVITEALGHALPVLATAVGGVPEALLGAAGADALCGPKPPSRPAAVSVRAAQYGPGMLVRPEDPGALAGGLREWLDDAGLRDRLRTAARERRASLVGWPDTVDRVAAVLAATAQPA
ncbi:MAG TPA: glycosyltransferase family 4 protein [Jatrophihabitans sp.]|nr:glycosyltransferase family 4 protein [Jatrophihabitans sp.]